VHLADYSAAARCLEEIFHAKSGAMLPIHLFQSLLGSAMLAVSLGAWEAAATLLGAADTAFRRTGWTELRLDRLDRESTQAAAQKYLGEAVFATAYAHGQMMAMKEAIQYALTAVAKVNDLPSASVT
jgi:hypothetical protein